MDIPAGFELLSHTQYGSLSCYGHVYKNNCGKFIVYTGNSCTVNIPKMPKMSEVLDSQVQAETWLIKETDKIAKKYKKEIKEEETKYQQRIKDKG